MVSEPVLNLTVHCLRFTLEASTFVHLGPQAGAQIRGALWTALQEFACTSPGTRTLEHTLYCPMCRLVALETSSVRGVNPPRPFAIQPPLPNQPGRECHFYPGENFTIGINLFGDAVALFPYVAQAVDRIGGQGIGYGRGRFTLAAIHATNPLTRATQSLFKQHQVIAMPQRMVNHRMVADAAADLPGSRLMLRFLTPMQLTAGKRIVSKPQFDVLIARLLERCQALEMHYTDQPMPEAIWRERYLWLTDLAKSVHMVWDTTRWVQVKSGSRRTNQMTAIGGFLGEAMYEGDLEPFYYWLLWGTLLHIGKSCAKGNGWYQLVKG